MSPPPVEWLAPLDPTKPSLEPDPGSLVLPVFPAQRLYFPFLRINLDIFGSSQKHRTMYNDILFSGARRFAVVKVDLEKKRLAKVGVVFYLDELRSEPTGKKKGTGVHRVIGRVKLHHVLNPSSVKAQDTYLKAQCELVVDQDSEVDTREQERQVCCAVAVSSGRRVSVHQLSAVLMAHREADAEDAGCSGLPGG